MSISERDLAGLALGGLCSHFKEKLKGYDYPYISQLQIRALVQECKFKNAKETCETHQSNTYVDCESDNSDNGKRKFMLLSLCGPLRLYLILVHYLRRFKRIGKKKLVLLLMFLSVIAYLMNFIETKTSNCLMSYRRLRS